MKRMQIFKAGTQTASNGATLDFGEAQLRETVQAYDPKLHEAPIVVGHPKDNAPAYGWVAGLEFAEDGHLQADVSQLEPQFEEMVKAGRFKKRSASFYRPDSPANPVPGVYYLRHVGFLGAQPPAVKGLADPEFNDNADDVVEFADAMVVSTLFRRMREFFIERFGAEDTDKVLPSYLIEDLEAEARDNQTSPSDFNEGGSEGGEGSPQDPPAGAGNTGTDPNQPTGDEMTPEEAQALKNRAETAETELAKYKAQETNFAEREKKLRRQELERSIDGLIDDGKLLPAQRQQTIDYAETLDDTREIEFSEGEDKKVKRTQLGQYLEMLANQPTQVDFAEHSKRGNDGQEVDFAELSDRANAWKDKQKGLGKHISTAQAVRDVKAGKDK